MTSLFECKISSQAHELNARVPLANMVYEILHTQLCVNMKCKRNVKSYGHKKRFSFIAPYITG